MRRSRFTGGLRPSSLTPSYGTLNHFFFPFVEGKEATPQPAAVAWALGTYAAFKIAAWLAALLEGGILSVCFKCFKYCDYTSLTMVTDSLRGPALARMTREYIWVGL